MIKTEEDRKKRIREAVDKGIEFLDAVKGIDPILEQRITGALLMYLRKYGY